MYRRTKNGLLPSYEAKRFFYFFTETSKWIYPCLLLLLVLSCNPKSSTDSGKEEGKTIGKVMSKNKSPHISESGRTILTGPIVRIQFMLKNGKYSDKAELYLRASVQDYFIKFCTSEVKEEVLETYLKEANLPDIMGDKVVSLEVDIVRDGFWDICEVSLEEIQQSRTGDYITIHRIINE